MCASTATTRSRCSPHCSDALDRARRGDGPTLLECVTFRFKGHYFGDPMAYIPAEQMAAAEAADPVPAFRRRLAEDGICTAHELDEIDAAADRAVEDAIETVMEAPAPPLDELDRDVYADAWNCPV